MERKLRPNGHNLITGYDEVRVGISSFLLEPDGIMSFTGGREVRGTKW